MNRQRKLLGLFAGAALFLAFLSVYPIPSHAPGTSRTHSITTNVQQETLIKEIPFRVIDQGDLAPGAKSRKNYAIYTQEELDSFWKLSHASDTAKAPTVDFKKQYVLVFFAGTKPTTGYKIKVTEVKDIEGKRNIGVAVLEPGKGCNTKNEKTSPYQFVSVPYDTESTLTHSDVSKKVDCK